MLAARAYYLSSSHDTDNLDRAEATLNELIDTIDSATDRVRRVALLGLVPHSFLLFALLGQPRAPTASLDADSCFEATEGCGVTTA